MKCHPKCPHPQGALLHKGTYARETLFLPPTRCSAAIRLLTASPDIVLLSNMKGCLLGGRENQLSWPHAPLLLHASPLLLLLLAWLLAWLP